MSRQKTTPNDLASLLRGDPEEKMTRVVSGARNINLIRLPPAIVGHFAAQGKNVFPASPHSSMVDIYGSRGAYVLTSDDLPDDTREAMLRDARRSGYTVRPDDHAIAKGGCVLFTQLESERQEWDDEERQVLADQMGEVVDMADQLNAQLQQEFGSQINLGRIGLARDGRDIPVPNPGGR